MRIAMACLLVASMSVHSTAPVSGQALGRIDRDPATALGFAWLCPGCGHLYSGETAKGAAIAVISIGAVATGIAIQLSRAGSWRECSLRVGQCDPANLNTSLTPVLAGGAIGLAGYIYGLVDAEPSARRMNARNGIGLGKVDMSPTVASDGAVGARFTISLTAIR
jgi:hypothetical protein